MRIFEFLYQRTLFLLTEDSGGGSGGTAPETEEEEADGASHDETEPEGTDGEGHEEIPGYFAQFPNEKAKSESYKTLYKYRKLDDLADALIKAEGRLAEMNDGRLLAIPRKGDKAGAAEFAKKLGVPDEPSGYRMEALSDYAKESPEIVEAIRKGCRRMLLTERQGEAVAEMIANVSKASAMRAALNIKDGIEKQADRVAALYSDKFTAEIDRKKAAEEDVARYQAFLQETGLADVINQSSLAGNPQLIRAIAAFSKKHGGVIHATGGSLAGGNGEKGKPVMDESRDWKDFKNQRR